MSKHRGSSLALKAGLFFQKRKGQFKEVRSGNFLSLVEPKPKQDPALLSGAHKADTEQVFPSKNQKPHPHASLI